MTQTQTWPDNLPDFDDPGPTVIRHRFGSPSALIVLVALLALGLLVTHLIAADRNSVYSYSLAPARLFSFAAILSEDLKARYLGTRVTDWEEYEKQQRAAREEARKEAIDWSFRILNPNDGKKLEVFLIRFGAHPHAEQRGYTRTAREALVRIRDLEDEAEEQRRRAEQRAVPWDMNVEPPESVD